MLSQLQQSSTLSLIEKHVPNIIMTTFRGPSKIISTKIYPPFSHPTHLIIPELYRVDVVCENGCIRSFGFKHAKIDSFLRVRVSGYSINFDEVNNWINAPKE